MSLMLTRLAVVDPVSAWNWQRRLMFAVAVVGTFFAVSAGRGSTLSETAYFVGVALLTAVIVRLIVWILPSNPPSDKYLPELVIVAAAVALIGISVYVRRVTSETETNPFAKFAPSSQSPSANDGPLETQCKELAAAFTIKPGDPWADFRIATVPTPNWLRGKYQQQVTIEQARQECGGYWPKPHKG